MEISVLTEQDWPAVRSIYEEGIATGNATFATSAPEWREWDASHLTHCRLAARDRAEAIGWAGPQPGFIPVRVCGGC